MKGIKGSYYYRLGSISAQAGLRFQALMCFQILLPLKEHRILIPGAKFELFVFPPNLEAMEVGIV